MIFGLDGFYNTRGNRFLITADDQVLKFPEYYWGIGNRTSEDDQELYQAWRVELRNALLKRFKHDIYIGPVFQFQSMFGLQYADSSQLESSAITGAAGGNSVGLGYAIYWDRRDNILNPSGGSSFLSLQHTGFSRHIGSDFGFQTVELDGRYYINTWRDHILAFQTYQYFSLGDPPFRMMGLLGSGSHMRGYYRGRYRDRHYLSAQMEYRLAIWKWVGMAAFAGLGEVTRDFRDIELTNLKYFMGGALRIRMSKEDNTWLRADFAVGKQTSGFYFTFGETF
jgi:outer membrane protein assembly factor BamA